MPREACDIESVVLVRNRGGRRGSSYIQLSPAAGSHTCLLYLWCLLSYHLVLIEKLLFVKKDRKAEMCIEMMSQLSRNGHKGKAV